MKKIITLIVVLTSFNLFAFDSFSLESTDSDYYEKRTPIANLEKILNQSEIDATENGRKILQTARAMILNQEIVLGSCWDYIDAAYNNAGFLDSQRLVVFKSKLQGPYVDDARIQGGDWLYFMNHSYGDVEHSSIFVAWTNFEKKEAIMISYSGGSKAVPARYKIYDLSSVYNIMRPRLPN